MDAVDRPAWTLRLAKEDFKFSVAHFTLFGADEAETLHGHNYRVSVEIAGDELDEAGLVADTDGVKRRVRELCAALDDHVLLPERSPWLEAVADSGSVECRYGTRLYRFPASEVVLLPLTNTTMELLARYFWRALAADLRSPRLRALAVDIEETAGQSCRYAAPLNVAVP
jgi:6-pyruvoyltetrahydropterin/6-carboxytetrahydropterin synthase